MAVGFAGLGLYQAWHDSPTFDEPVYVAAGLASLTRHDLRLNPEHPPLAKALAALPALAVHPVIPHTAAWTQGAERVYSAQFLQAQLRAGTLQRVMFAARLVPLAEAIAAAFVLYALARRLFSPWAGVLAGGLWLAGPLVLGLGHLDGIDLPFTLAALVVSLALVRVLEIDRPDPRTRSRLLQLGLACGLAAASKDTGLFLAAMAPVVVLASGWRARRGRSVVDGLLVGLVAWATIWVTYLVIAPGSVAHVGLLPHPDIVGLRFLSTNDTQSGPGYLLGSFWVGGRWWYWPVSLVIKLPLITLGVLVVGPVGLAFVDRSVRRRTLAAVVLPAVILTAFTVPGPRDIGVRYLLPVVALWLVAASAVTRIPWARIAGTARTGRTARVVATVATALVLVVAVGVTAASNPHSIAWTSLPFRPGYQVASDSNVDWGQDFYRLQAWSQGRHPAVAYFGPRGLSAAQVPGARELSTVPPDRLTGWVAVSATLLTTNDHAALSWLRAYCPLSTLGGSILVYRFARPPDRAAGPDRPAAVCGAGATFSSRPPAPRPA
jgi:4-amino-4-deoxy-L-arabinose transferase-like glycosyltransferase